MRATPLVIALSSSLLITTVATAQATDSARPSQAGEAGPSLRLQSFSIIVPDYDEAKAWYTTRLGLVVVRDQAFGTNERFVMMAAPGNRDVGIVLQKARTERRPDEPNMPTDYSDRVGKTVNVVLHSGDVTAYAAGLTARGVKLDGPPRRLPWGGQVTFKDLYGNSFVVVGPLTARDPAGR